MAFIIHEHTLIDGWVNNFSETDLETGDTWPMSFPSIAAAEEEIRDLIDNMPPGEYRREDFKIFSCEAQDYVA